ncbi:Flp family type IVb pilin [Vibrio diazotrophicus]|jgi:pilus assembly protein Flp/PilA|nr:Flp family type IVb pilin [Vibrio diazotrophicus]
MNKFIEQVKTFWADEDGLSAVEYVVAGSLVVAGLVTAFTNLGAAMKVKLNEIITALGGTAAT